MPKRFAPGEIERAESIRPRQGTHGGGPKLCAAHEVFRRKEWPALLPRLNQAFGIFFAQARNQAQAKA